MFPIVISSIIFVSGIVIITWLHNQYQNEILVEPVEFSGNAPLISVCVPARNEERNIGRCVATILKQTYPNFELIVLDDRSTDGTGEILRDLATQDDRLKILNGSNLPRGWAGKPYALTQAAAAAYGEWLCFVDADTFLSPDALASVYSKAMEKNADLLDKNHYLR